MKKLFAIVLTLAMVLSMGATVLAAEDKTIDITYNASENEGVDDATWTVTVPATLAATTEGEIEAQGSWAPSDILTVTADENINMYLNGDQNADYTTVPVSFNPIALAGSYEGAVSVTETVTVDPENTMGDIKFGKWEGTLTFRIELNDDPNYVHGNINPYAGYSVVQVAGQDELDSAIAQATEKTVYELSAGTYTFYNNGSYANKQIVLKGTTGVTIDASGLGNEVYGDEITFDNVSIQFPDATHKGITHTNKVVFNNCTLSGTQTLYAPTVEFNNCTFTGNDGKDIYYVWTYGVANATFRNCVFNTNGKAILCYTESAVEANVTLENCTFNSDKTIASGKAAVEVGTDNHVQTFNLTFTNCTADDFAANNSTSPLWGNKNSMDDAHLNVVIDGVAEY